MRRRYAPATAAGRFNRNTVTLVQAGAEFRRHRLDRAILARDEGPSRRTVSTTSQSPRALPTAGSPQSHFAIREQFNLTDKPLPTLMLTTAAPARSTRNPPHPP